MLAMVLALSLMGSRDGCGVERTRELCDRLGELGGTTDFPAATTEVGRESSSAGIKPGHPSLGPISVQTLPEEIELESGDEWGRRDWEHEA